MRQCYRCWKNLKLNPANTLHRKDNNENYLICDKCINSNIVKELLESGKWEIILNTPTLEETKEY